MGSEIGSKKTSDQFNLAIVGAGLITQNAHLPTALSLPGVKVRALVDPVLARAQGLAQTYGLKILIAASVEEVIGKVDGAIVATPNHTHRAVAVPQPEAGLSLGAQLKESAQQI